MEWIRPRWEGLLVAATRLASASTLQRLSCAVRHQQIYGDKARLIYITKPSLLIDVISAFVDVLGVDGVLAHGCAYSPEDRRNPTPAPVSSRRNRLLGDRDGRRREEAQSRIIIKSLLFSRRAVIACVRIAFSRKYSGYELLVRGSYTYRSTSLPLVGCWTIVMPFVSIGTLGIPRIQHLQHLCKDRGISTGAIGHCG